MPGPEEGVGTRAAPNNPANVCTMKQTFMIAVLAFYSMISLKMLGKYNIVAHSALCIVTSFREKQNDFAANIREDEMLIPGRLGMRIRKLNPGWNGSRSPLFMHGYLCKNICL